MHHPLERRWLHYAFSSEAAGLALVANLSTLTPEGPDDPQHMSILLLHDRTRGWCSSQFNAARPDEPWSAFDRGRRSDRLVLGAQSGAPAVDLVLTRTSHPCTSQCAPFARFQHLRWQSESGVMASGDWTLGPGDHRRSVRAVGYHERVRGIWGWPELGGWVFGFANDQRDLAVPSSVAPPWAVVFTLIQPPAPDDAATGSVMLWRGGRLRRHFPRRRVSVAVQGTLDRNLVVCVPPLARLFGVAPAAPVPRRLVIRAAMGDDHVVLDVVARTAARIVNPSETSFDPFSVHEVLGDCSVEGRLGAQEFEFRTEAIVEFAGGAGG